MNLKVAARAVVALVSLPLLYWAGDILSNIATYNDSGTLRYVAFAAVPGLPGLLLLLVGPFGFPRHGRRIADDDRVGDGGIVNQYGR